MAKKSELEQSAIQYHDCVANARAALREKRYMQALAAARKALPFVDEMMQFERRYNEKEFESVEAIDILFRYSPLFFDIDGLNQVEALLGDFRRVEKLTSEDMGEKLADARGLALSAHRLWTHLEDHPCCSQNRLAKALGESQELWRGIVEDWAHAGLIRRVPESGTYVLSLATRLDDLIEGKCFHCGAIEQRPKRDWLVATQCGACGKTDFAVLVRPQAEEKVPS